MGICRTSVGTLRLLILVVTAVAIAMAASHRPRLHPNPGITIFDIAEGADGLLWLAAEDGLYRYDGFRYLKIASPSIPSARFVGVTQDGSVWAGGANGLFRNRGQDFEQVLSQGVEALAALPDGVLAQLARDGVWFVPQEGPNIRPIDGLRQFLTLDSTKRPWYVCGKAPHHDLFACTLDGDYNPQLVDILPLWSTGVLPDRRGRWVVTDSARAEVLDDGVAVQSYERRPIQATQRSSPLMPGSGGQVWFIGETVYGIDPPVELRERAEPDAVTYPTAAMEDSRGRLWVAWRGRGLVEWTLDPGWERWYLEDFSGESLAQVDRIPGRGPMIAAAGDALYRLSPERVWSRLEGLGRRIAAFRPLPQGGFLASLREAGLARLDKEGRLADSFPLPYDPSPRHYIADQFREILQDSKGRWWVGGKASLMQIELDPPALTDDPMPGADPSRPLPVRDDNTPDLELGPDGRLWVGAPEGLVVHGDDDVWRVLPTDRPIDMVRSFAPGRDDAWVAHRAGGPHFTRLVREDDVWRVEEFAADAGYGPRDSHFLKRDSRGWIWRGSTDGVHVADGRRLAPDDWLHLHTGNGLTANLTEIYGFLEDDDGSVWLTGFEGVTRVEPDPAWFETPTDPRPPTVSRLTADGVNYISAEEIPSGAYEVVILVGSLDAPAFRDQPLRYRVTPTQRDWRLSSDGRIRIEQPRNGDYRLEAAFSSDPADAPPRLVHSFRVGPPPAWSGWPWMFAAAGAMLCLALMVAPQWREGLFYRLSKAWFLAKRRLEPQGVTPSGSTGPTAALEPGDRLRGQYLIERVVSTGGFSTVYLATNLQDPESSVAVKALALRPGADRWVRDRFVHEVASLRTVRHPGVVLILDSWVSSDGSPCLVMPFLEGPTLRQELDRQGAFSRQRSARLLRRLGEAVSAVHAYGIVHRDLKPENILLVDAADGSEQPVLIDFGLAAIRAAEGELAGTTMMAGSLPYMAPERLLNRFSAASDLYSLAVLALELVTGRRPSDDQNEGQEEDYEPYRLAERLEAFTGADRAVRLGELLASGLALLARSRPTDAAGWCAEVADILESE